jgi:hypothetical protein
VVEVLSARFAARMVSETALDISSDDMQPRKTPRSKFTSDVVGRLVGSVITWRPPLLGRGSDGSRPAALFLSRHVRHDDRIALVEVISP